MALPRGRKTRRGRSTCTPLARAGVGRRLLAAGEELRLEASLNAVDFCAAHGWVEGPRSSRVSCRASARVRVDDEAVVVSSDHGHPRRTACRETDGRGARRVSSVAGNGARGGCGARPSSATESRPSNR